MPFTSKATECGLAGSSTKFYKRKCTVLVHRRSVLVRSVLLQFFLFHSVWRASFPSRHRI